MTSASTSASAYAPPPPASRARPQSASAVLRAFIVLTTLVATAVTAAAFAVTVNGALHEGSLMGSALATALITGLIVTSRAASVAFTFRKRRFGLNGDEVVLLVAAALVAPANVVVAVAAGTAIVEVLKRRDAWKTAFNVASYTVAAAGAVTAFVLLTRAGVPPQYAVLVVPPVAALIAYGLLAQVLALLDDESMARIFATRFVGITLTSSMLGMALGSAIVSLYHASPVLPFVLAPLLFAAWHVTRVEARRDRELATHRALADMSRVLVDCRHPGPIADAVVESCTRVFDAHEVDVTLSGASGERVDRASIVKDTEAGDEPALRVPVTGMDGVTVGVLVVCPRKGARPFREHERALAETIASAAAVALATADGLAGMASARGRLDAYLNASQDVILVLAPTSGTGESGLPRYENECARALAARAAGGADDVRARLQDALVDAEPGGDGSRDVAVPLADGGRVQMEVRSASVPGGDVLVVARDVTEARRLATVQADQRRAVERNERLASLGTLVAGVAHEVNNPLMYMRGQTELVMMDLAALEDGVPVDAVDLADASRRLERVVSGIERLESVSRNLGRVAKGGTAGGGTVDVRALVQRVTEVIGYGAPPGVTIDVDVGPDPVHVHGDATALEQAIMNVVQNAMEAAPQTEGRVHVRTFLDDADGLVVQVRDNGAGIAPEDVERIFSPFHTTKHEGTGLGLSFVQATVSAHAGTIHVDPRPGEGAIVTVRLPRLAEAAA